MNEKGFVSGWKVFKIIWFVFGGFILLFFLYGLLGILTANGSKGFGFVLIFVIAIIGLGGYFSISFIIFLIRIFTKKKK